MTGFWLGAALGSTVTNVVLTLAYIVEKRRTRVRVTEPPHRSTITTP